MPDEARSAGDAGVVDEQADAPVAFHHRRGDTLDVLAVAHVTHLVLGPERFCKRSQPLLTAGEEHDAATALRERTRNRRADPARRSRDNRDVVRQRQTRTSRVAARVLPPASVATAVSS